MNIDIKIIMSIHIITASLSATRLAVLGGEGGRGTTRTRLVWGERDGLPAKHRLPAHHQHILLTKERTETHPRERIRNRPINLVLCSASGKELARDIPDASK